MSIIGPNTRKLRSEPLLKLLLSDSAKNASTVAQIETIPARTIRAMIETTGLVPILFRILCGIVCLNYSRNDTSCDESRD